MLIDSAKVIVGYSNCIMKIKSEIILPLNLQLTYIYTIPEKTVFTLI